LREAKAELLEGLEAFYMPLELAEISFADMGGKVPLTSKETAAQLRTAIKN